MNRQEMATVQENWHTNCTSISQRTKYIFNTALLSDVKFIVPVSNGESKSKVIPAHQLVLAIGSPVFFAMFYGQMADPTRDSIELPDCDYESLLELFLISDDFVATERSLGESVVKREKLNVKEVELFKAVNRWAQKEIEEQRIVTDGNAKRRIIGEEILKEIRSPLMLEKEFASFVIDSNILNMQEVGVMIKHYNQVQTSPLPYLQSPRIVVLKRVCRFKYFTPHSATGTTGMWSYSAVPDNLVLDLNKDVRLHGVQHFGREGCEYTVSMETKDATTNLSIVK